MILAEKLFKWIAERSPVQKISWSLRRLCVPVHPNALVLEVGSGGNPYPRANVLLDAYEETRERHWEPLVHDRPTVLAFGENLPFKDKAFDFVIAAHVLEHTPHPEKFLSELQRVAKAGYIETPDAFMERINPYKDHRLEVMLKEDTLFIRKKTSWIIDQDLVDLYERHAKHWITRELIPGHPAAFHMRYLWKDKINFKILNPQTEASWTPVMTDRPAELPSGIKQTIRIMLLTAFRRLFSQNRRNKNLDLLTLLRCPECRTENLERQKGQIVCKQCNLYYKAEQNMYQMNSDSAGARK